MSRPTTSLRVSLAMLIATQAIVSPAVAGVPGFDRLRWFTKETHYEGHEPPTCEDTAVERLAEHIDWLEHHIDEYGSIVAKVPDVYGEARLTKHRDEYERVLFKELGNFEETFNAAISQADASFLSQALALAAASGDAVINPQPAPGAAMAPPAANATLVNAQAVTVNPGSTLPNLARFGKVQPQTGDAVKGLKLEPVLKLDQLSRYVNHLQELRRVNEGDDTSDSPGYALNLIRMPVSVLPGKLTRKGYGAEITVTATPVIGDDLLPTTFRNLVINDVVDLTGLTIVRIAESIDRDRIPAIAASATLKATIRQITEAFADSQDGSVSELEQSQIEDAFQSLFDNEIASATVKKAVRRSFRPLCGDTKESESSSGDLNASIIKMSAVRDTMLDGEVRDYIAKLQASTTKSKAALNKLRKLNDVAEPDRHKNTEGFKGPVFLAQLRGTRQSQYDYDTWYSGVNTFVENTSTSTCEFVKALVNEQPKDATKYLLQLQTEKERSLSLDLAKAFSILSDRDAYSEEIEWTATDALEELAKLSDILQRRLEAEARLAFNIAVPSGRVRRALSPVNPTSIGPVLSRIALVTIAKRFLQPYRGRYVRWAGGSEAPTEERRIDLLDARRFLQAETEAAYDLLSEPKHVGLLASLTATSSGLAEAIRSGRFDPRSDTRPVVEEYRHYFFTQLHDNEGKYADQASVAICHEGDNAMLKATVLARRAAATAIEDPETCVEALAWAVVVEAALLNERLNRDIRKFARAKQVYDLETPRDYLFSLPDTVAEPDPRVAELRPELDEAVQVFNRYVEARWPIHVFAIDPREQDQNVIDVSNRKREMQFALALGFTTGKIGINSLTQYSRELQTQIETISLNRTVVGFGHGSDTFGWRFQPRVQSLHVPGVVGSIRETLCGTPRDYDLRHRQLEPGKRECVALVLMPSFVPYADFDVRTNWYKLTNPKKAALTMKDTVRMSRAVSAMKRSRAQCAQCAHLYRDGEINRLMNRVDQLDGELPLQTMRALIPYENTLGGFELFTTGLGDLAPELFGWYGAPGVRIGEANNCGCYQGCGLTGVSATGSCADKATCDEIKASVEGLTTALAKLREAQRSDDIDPLPRCEGPGTTLFLVGDNFSVHDTKVIAGGVCIPHVRLISRELMRVTIPSCVNTVELVENGKPEEYVSVYVATPYGVTNHLHVPVHHPAKKPAEVKAIIAEAEQEFAKKQEQRISDAIRKQVDSTRFQGEIAVAPIGQPSALAVKATRVEGQPEKLELSIDATKIPSILATTDDLRDPRFSDVKMVKFYGIVYANGEFQDGGLVSLAKQIPIEKHMSFPALGKLIGREPAGWQKLKQQLTGPAEKHFRTNAEPFECSIFFYAGVGKEHAFTRLREPLKVTISLGAGNRIASTPRRTARRIPLPLATPVVQSLELPPPIEAVELGTLEPSTLPPVEDCGCDAGKEARQMSYFRLAQVPAVAGSVPPPISDGAVQSALIDRLDRLTSAVSESIQQQERLREDFENSESPKQSGPIRVDVQVAPAAVTVNPPPQRDQPANDLPLVDRFKTSLGECWRNVRDQLPGS